MKKINITHNALLVVAMFCLHGLCLNAQDTPLVFDVGEVEGCFQDTVLVPVTVSGYQDVMIFSCYVEWDYDALEYIGIVNKKMEEIELVADLTLSPLDGEKLVIGTEDLLSQDISRARTFVDGDTLFCIKLVVRAQQDVWSITSSPAVLVDNTFFYVENGSRAFSEDMSIAPGEVQLTQSVSGLEVTGATIICGRPEVDLIAVADNPATDFNWSFGGVFFSSDSIVTVDEPGIYELEAFRGINCNTSTSFEVVRDTARARPLIDITPLSCIPDSATQTILSPSAEHSYDWRLNGAPVSDDSILTVSTPGTYELITTVQQNNCIDTQRVVLVAPAITDELAQVAISGIDTLSCTRDSVVLFVPLSTNEYSFAWTGGNLSGEQTDSTLILKEPGNYSLSITTMSDGCARTVDTVIRIDTIAPQIQVLGSNMLDCRADSTVLIASSLQPNTEVDFFWRSTAQALLSSEDRLTVSEEGVYTLEAISLSNGCTEETEVNVVQNTDRPQVNFQTPITPVTCSEPALPIILEDFSEVSYHWIMGADTLFSGATVSLPPGAFELVAFNETNGCFRDTLISITADTLSPIFTIDSTGELLCEQGVVSLEIKTSSTGNRCYWDDVPAVDCILTVNTSGTYTGRLENPGNGCSTEIAIAVSSTGSTNPLVVRVPDTINCRNREVELSIVDTEPGQVYEWLNAAGNTVGAGPSFLVSEGGIFRVEVAGQTGACARTTETLVLVDTIAPMVSVEDMTLNCDVTMLELSYDSPDPHAIPTWTGPNQLEVENTNITSGGEYTLLLTSPASGCSVSRLVNVVQDTTPPVYQLGNSTDITLTCREPEATAQVSYTGDYEISWSQFPGTITTSADSTTIVDEGDVLLVVSDATNGCEDSIVISVSKDQDLPALNYETSESFDCGQDTVTISINEDENVAYTVTNISGQELEMTLVGDFLVENSGMYTLNANNTITGCQASTSFTISDPETDLAFSGLSVRQAVCAEGSISEVSLGDGTGGVPEYNFTIAGQDYMPFDFVNNLDDGTYTLRLSDGQNCFIDTVITLLSYVPFQPQIEGVLDGYSVGEEVELSLAGNLDPAFTYTTTWMAGDSVCVECPGLNYVAQSSQEVLLSVMRSDGCVETVSEYIIVDQTPKVYLPSAFSPNGDGINDNYLPLSDPNNVVVVEMAVFDRWGQQVFFHSTGDLLSSGGWDGNIGNEPAGVGSYVIQVQYLMINGQSGVLKGDFTLLR